MTKVGSPTQEEPGPHQHWEEAVWPQPTCLTFCYLRKTNVCFIPGPGFSVTAFLVIYYLWEWKSAMHSVLKPVSETLSLLLQLIATPWMAAHHTEWGAGAGEAANARCDHTHRHTGDLLLSLTPKEKWRSVSKLVHNKEVSPLLATSLGAENFLDHISSTS